MSQIFPIFLKRNIVNVLEVLFLNSFLELALGFFWSPVGKISPKKKTRCCIMPSMDGWMNGWDGWKASQKATKTSFTTIRICV
jgi:hypothetical protein